MNAFIKKYQFLTYSILTIIVSVLLWFFAKEQSGSVKMLLTQFGYFTPAFVAILLTVILEPAEQPIRIKSYLPFIAVILCIIIISMIYGDRYYQTRIDKLLYENPLISIIVVITLIYFIWQAYENKITNSIDRLINLPKTNILWYILAISLYPLSKLAGVFISNRLFPSPVEVPDIKIILLIPLFLFSIIFYAGIGEEVGWRGFALKKLQMRYNPFVASLFIGIVWSVWHIGYFTLIENYGLENLPGVVIWTLMASFLSTWFFNKTNGNILVLILFHASVNFAIIFKPPPVSMFVIHVVLLIVVFLTGQFFKKRKYSIHKVS